jgi:hypothetical protein
MRHLGNPADRQAILKRLEGLSPGARPHWGRMTAHGMVCHLADSFRVPLGERSASMATGLYQRTLMKWAALYLVSRWPHNRPTRPEVEQGAGGSHPVDFEADRARLAQSIARFSEPGRQFAGRLHPMFGEMTPRQWLRWGYFAPAPPPSPIRCVRVNPADRSPGSGGESVEA